MSQTDIRLDHVLGRDLSVKWYEGVALVQAVCRVVLAGGTLSHAFPQPSEIWLEAGGGVSVDPTSKGTGTVGAAHVLAQMLGADVPVRLRLLVSEMTGPECSSSTLSEFSESLAYFERPDGRQVLEQLYQRAALAHARDEGRQKPEPARSVANEPVKQQSAAQQASRRPGALAVTVALLLCATAAVAAVGYRSGRMDVVRTRVQEWLERARGTAAADRPADQPSAVPDAPTGKEGSRPHEPAAAGAVVRGGRSDRNVATPTVPLQVLPPIVRPVRRAGGFFRPPDRDLFRPLFLDETPIVVVADAAAEDAGLPADGDVFSKEDRGVTPPRSVYPKLPPESERPPAKGRTILELIVGVDGLVERVRLRTPPRDIHEFMLVSAAKAWRFEPATVQGHPVRFLHRIAITTP